MYREIITDMAEWKDSENRKLLLILGAKGVGKTWAAKDFGSGFFDSTIIIDFKENKSIKYLFDGGYDKNRLIEMFLLYSGGKSDPKNCLIILDNIHLVNNPYKLMEFIIGNMSEYYICMITYLRESVVFSNENYRKFCDIITMYPLSFGEFLIENKESHLASRIENYKTNPLTDKELEIIEQYLKIFYCTGGMPLVVKDWITNHNFESVNKIKRMILDDYNKEFNAISQTTLKNKVLEVWNSIAPQLEKENKKFLYGTVKLTARAREYSNAVKWLYERRYISKLCRAKNAVSPLSENEESKSFELFMIDIGLLSSVYGIEYNQIKDGLDGLLSHNNALNEQFVYQELLYNKNFKNFYYWTSDATARIEFIFEDSGQVIPIVINIDGNKKAQNLKVFAEKYHSPISIKITYKEFSMEEGTLNVPVYSVWNL